MMLTKNQRLGLCAGGGLAIGALATLVYSKYANAATTGTSSGSTTPSKETGQAVQVFSSWVPATTFQPGGYVYEIAMILPSTGTAADKTALGKAYSGFLSTNGQPGATVLFMGSVDNASAWPTEMPFVPPTAGATIANMGVITGTYTGTAAAIPAGMLALQQIMPVASPLTPTPISYKNGMIYVVTSSWSPNYFVGNAVCTASGKVQQAIDTSTAQVTTKLQNWLSANC